MNLVFLTPGTGGMYCGSCLRDEMLAKALRKLGHSVTIVPLYLPMMLEEPDAGPQTPVFFGGINVYLQQKTALFRKTPGWVDRIADAPGLLRWAAGFTGSTSAKDLGEITLSVLRGEEGNQAKELDKLLAWLKTQPKPSVVCLNNALLAGLARKVKAELNVPVACTLHGEDTFLDGFPAPYKEEAWKVLSERCRDLDAMIAVSEYYASVMAGRLNASRERVHVVYNGVDASGFEEGKRDPRAPVLGYFARMCADKGLGALVEAFIELKKRDRVSGLRMCVGGSCTGPDEAYVRGLKGSLDQAGLGAHVEWHPNVDLAEKKKLYSCFSVFSVPALYGEAFGLYVIEALASGVPVVQPQSGAFPELLRATGGVLYDPALKGALSEALETLLLDPERAGLLGRAGRDVVREKFSAEAMARNTLNVLEKLG